MTDYALTLWSIGLGWRNVRVRGARDIREAIRLAEHATGCRVSHGRGSPEPLFDVNEEIDAETGNITLISDHVVRPEVIAGPPDVVRAIAMVLKPKQ